MVGSGLALRGIQRRQTGLVSAMLQLDLYMTVRVPSLSRNLAPHSSRNSFSMLGSWLGVDMEISSLSLRRTAKNEGPPLRQT